MASKIKNLGTGPSAEIDGSSFQIGIIVAEYHEHITFKLRDGAVETLKKHGVVDQNIVIEYVPGAFELPMAAALLQQSDYFDALICIGCVIKGDTDHDVYINQAVTNELMRLSTDFMIPIQYGLLTTNTEQQAIDRAGGALGNKGAECALATLKMVAMAERLINIEGEDDLALFN